MKLINHDTDYAIRALNYIGEKPDRLVSVIETAHELRIPHPFLRRILQTLQKNNLVMSYKGRDGGFKLARALDKIFLVDVIKIFQGPIELMECFFKKNLCKDVRQCVLRRRIEEIETRVLSELRTITVASLGHNHE